MSTKELIHKLKSLEGKNKKLIENFLSLNVLQIISYIFPLITLPYLSRVLGADKFGLVFFAYSLGQYFIIFTDFGFLNSASIEVSINRDNKDKLSDIFSSILYLKLILLIISFLIITLIIFNIDKFRIDWMVFYLTFLMVIGNAIFPSWFFQGIEQMKYITVLNTLSKLISLILIFVFIKNTSDYIYMPILNALGFIVSGILGIYIAITKYGIRIKLPNLKDISYQFKYSISFAIAQFFNTFSTNTNTFFLGLISSNTIVGYYVAAEKIYYALFSLSGPINLTMTPYMAKNRNIPLYKKVFMLTTILIIVVASVMFFFSKEIINTFYGPEMDEAHKLLKLFAILIIVIFYSMYIGLPLLGAFNYTKQLNLSTIIGAISHIFGLFIIYYLKILTPANIIICAILSTSITLLTREFFINKYKLLKN